MYTMPLRGARLPEVAATYVVVTRPRERWEEGKTVAEYAHPELLVSTDWVAAHGQDAGVRIAESDEDALLYEQGHIPGAVKVDWHTDLQDPLRRDFVNKAGFEKLCAERGISNDTTVVFYGDRNNWFATYSLWLFRY